MGNYEWFFVCLACFIFGFACGHAIVRRVVEAERRKWVHHRDLWFSTGSKYTFGLYEVVKPNINTEAGPDSWVMRRCEDGKTAYMHHGQRMAGEWILMMREGEPMCRSSEVSRTFAPTE